MHEENDDDCDDDNDDNDDNDDDDDDNGDDDNDPKEFLRSHHFQTSSNREKMQCTIIVSLRPVSL